MKQKMKRLTSILPALVMALGLFTGALAAPTTFTDVPSGAWYYDAVQWAVDHDPQITQGTSETTFSPDAPCTRAQAMTFLWRANGKPAPISAVNPFTDVKDSDYFYNAVLWAVENQITNGTSETTFGPEDPCTRAHVVSFLYRLAKEPSVSGSNPFVDVSSGAYYYHAVLWAVTNGITKGTPDDTHFSPDVTCDRAQIVTLLFRYLAPRFTMQPKDAAVLATENATFSVAVTGGKALYTYEWHRISKSDSADSKVDNNMYYSGATTATLTVKSIVSYENGDQYYCIVRDANGSKISSQKATLTVYSALSFTKQPADASAYIGGSTTVSVEATGGKAPYTYQWHRISNADNSDKPLPDSLHFSGTTTATLTVKECNSNLNGDQYYCIVRDANGTKITSNKAKFSALLTITIQPTDTSADVGSSAQFKIGVAGGKAPYTYVWYEYGPEVFTWTKVENRAEWSGHYTISSLGGNSTLTAKNIHQYFNQNGIRYRCEVTDANGTKRTSDAATLTVNVPPPLSVSISPTTASARAGEKISIKATPAGGTGGYTYKWYYRSSTMDYFYVASQKEQTYTPAFQYADTWYCYCQVTDSSGTYKTSSWCTVTVTGTPVSVSISPTSTSVYVYEWVKIKATAAGGTGNYTYAWYYRKSPSEIWQKSGMTTDTYGPAYESVGTYYCYCTVTDSAGVSKSSGQCTITVNYRPITVDINHTSISAKVNERLNIKVAAFGGSGGYRYDWKVYNSVTGKWDSAGVSTNTYMPVFTSAGNYYCYCRVTDSAGNSKNSDTCTITVKK